jgi:hypothetical protein
MMISDPITGLAVIARSDSDEAIQTYSRWLLDCFAPLAMTIQPQLNLL